MMQHFINFFALVGVLNTAAYIFVISYRFKKKYYGNNVQSDIEKQTDSPKENN